MDSVYEADSSNPSGAYTTNPREHRRGWYSYKNPHDSPRITQRRTMSIEPVHQHSGESHGRGNIIVNISSSSE